MLENAWKLETAITETAFQKRERMEVIYDAIRQSCSDDCEEQWCNGALEGLQSNSMHWNTKCRNYQAKDILPTFSGLFL